MKRRPFAAISLLSVSLSLSLVSSAAETFSARFHRDRMRVSRRCTAARGCANARVRARACNALTTRRFRCMPEREAEGTPRANRFPSFSTTVKGRQRSCVNSKRRHNPPTDNASRFPAVARTSNAGPTVPRRAHCSILDKFPDGRRARSLRVITRNPSRWNRDAHYAGVGPLDKSRSSVHVLLRSLSETR